MNDELKKTVQELKELLSIEKEKSAVMSTQLDELSASAMQFQFSPTPENSHIVLPPILPSTNISPEDSIVPSTDSQEVTGLLAHPVKTQKCLVSKEVAIQTVSHALDPEILSDFSHRNIPPEAPSPGLIKGIFQCFGADLYKRKTPLAGSSSNDTSASNTNRNDDSEPSTGGDEISFLRKKKESKWKNILELISADSDIMDWKARNFERKAGSFESSSKNEMFQDNTIAPDPAERTEKQQRVLRNDFSKNFDPAVLFEEEPSTPPQNKFSNHIPTSPDDTRTTATSHEDSENSPLLDIPLIQIAPPRRMKSLVQPASDPEDFKDESDSGSGLRKSILLHK
eukprot:Filipodium_phascolosomae@DN8239_c0_g1_i1.p1